MAFGIGVRFQPRIAAADALDADIGIGRRSVVEQHAARQKNGPAQVA